MAKRIGIRGSEVIALAVKMANVDFIAAYPITPQSHVVEKLSEYVGNGELDAEFINVESEHSALSACIGASAAGARVFTATCSQGLALMHEIVYITSGLRLPIVMAIAHRALSAPLNVGCDHCDSLAERDSGWIQIYVENCQEAFDSILQAFKVAEDHRVLLPTMVCMDGFYLSHAIEAIEVPTEEQVTQFLPPRTPIHVLDPSKPVTMGAWVTEEHYTPFKMRQEEAMNRARTVIKEVNEEFGRIFGRKYGNGLVDPYKTDDAEIILVLMGSMAGTARIVVDQARANGRRIGLLRIRTYRPFPIKDVREILRKAKVVAVISRDISLGAYGGIALSEIRSTLYELQERPHVVGFIVGLGGKDVRTYDFSAIIDQAYDVLEKDRVDKDFNFVK